MRERKSREGRERGREREGKVGGREQEREGGGRERERGREKENFESKQSHYVSIS